MALTKEQALAFLEAGAWKPMTFRERAEFQLFENRLCMPFEKFQEALEKTLGRSVFVHELAFPESLRKEIRGDKPAPTFEEIMRLIPPDKRKLIMVKP